MIRMMKSAILSSCQGLSVNQFLKHAVAAISANTQVSWQRKKQSLSVFYKKGVFKKVPFQQIRQKKRKIKH